MGIYMRPSRYLKLRLTRRGLRAGIGPRWLRIWLGSGGHGVSTGAGPFSAYRPLRRRRRRRQFWGQFWGPVLRASSEGQF